MNKFSNHRISAIYPDHKAAGLTCLAVLALLFAMMHPTVSYSNVPLCLSGDSDPDNDGWGWENSATCIVEAAHNNRNPVHPTCSLSDSDPDGDGWGWENNQSCRVGAPKMQHPYCNSIDSDSDGDGWGWEYNASCIVNIAGDITDLILITGQSNTLGAGTAVDASLDVPHARVFAFTSEGWQVAQLYQTWDRNAYPGPGIEDAHPSLVYNNLALHFGRRLAELDPNRIVGFILVSEPGEGIENWNPGSNGLLRVQQKVAEAINQLPHKSALDGILWHQGETDWLFEGTSDPDVAQPAPVDYYPVKLARLISNFRSENWYTSAEPFICGETIRAEGVNMHLNALNTDDDPQTACVDGFGLEATTTPGSHFTAAGLRLMGGWYAESYFKLTQ